MLSREGAWAVTDIPMPLPWLSSKLPWHCGLRADGTVAPGVPSSIVWMTPRCSYLEVSSGNVATHAQGHGTLAKDMGKRQSEEVVPGQSQRKQAQGAPALPHSTQSCHPPVTAGAPKGIAWALPTAKVLPGPERKGAEPYTLPGARAGRAVCQHTDEQGLQAAKQLFPLRGGAHLEAEEGEDCARQCLFLPFTCGQHERLPSDIGHRPHCPQARHPPAPRPFLRHFSRESVSVRRRSSRNSERVLEERARRRLCSAA